MSSTHTQEKEAADTRDNRFSLTRVHTGQYLDDHSVYHPHGEREKINRGLDPDEHDVEWEDQEAQDQEDREKGIEEEPEICNGIRDIRDAEPGRPQLEKQKSSRSIRSVRDPYEVTWDGPDDPKNPKNWLTRRKWLATFVVSSYTFISPLSSTMVSPSIQAIAQEFNITNEVVQQMVLSTFVLAYAVGPLFLGPLSEVYGRARVLQLANLFFLVFNTACGGCTSSGQMIAFRFLSGLGGSAPLAVGGGVLSDAWTADQRGAAISVYSLMPLLGPAIGPIAGSFITENTTWRWGFYAVSIACALIQFNGLFFLRETYAPMLLAQKAARLRKETSNPEFKTKAERDGEKRFAKILGTSLVRPFRLLSTQVIVQFLAIYMAFIYGLMYLLMSAFPPLWTQRYGQTLGLAGLNYIALGLGFFLGAQICAPLNDRIYRRLKKRNNGAGRPEFRVPLMLPGALLQPIGLFIYGWSAQYRVHWIVPDIGGALFSAGAIICFQCIQTYLVDSYTRFAASAIAAATVLRSLCGFAFPLFAPYMYAALDYGWGNSLLAFLGLALGVPAPLTLWFFGAKLRAKSPFAAGGGN